MREFNEKSLIRYAKDYFLKRRITFLNEVNSTNTYAKTLCSQGKGAGALVVADSQTAGRGRRGRSFVSNPDAGVYFSAVYTLSGEEKAAGLLTSLAGLAVRDALYSLYNLQCTIKWPNDILCEGKKLCGILCEAVNENGRAKYAVVGIGLNVQKQDFPDELSLTAGSIADFYDGEIDRSELVAEIVFHLDRLVLKRRALMGHDAHEYTALLKKYSDTVGKQVKVILPDSEEYAEAIDIADNGGLVVKTMYETKVLTAGEVVHPR